MRHIYHESAFDTATPVGSLWEDTAGDLVECTDLAGEENVGLRSGFPRDFGIHPMKYVRGLARAAQQHGVVIHEHAPVEGWSKDGDMHVLSTPKGEVRAKQVIIATNGYTAEDTHKGLAGRILPGLSNILVSRPLSQEEIEAQGWSTTDLCYDSRKLLHYIRLLPDGRFMFGGRWKAGRKPRHGGSHCASRHSSCQA